MLDNFLHFILKQRLLVILGSIVLLTAGIIAWKNLPIDAFPDVTNEQVMILTEAPGLTPAEVERLITFPIEIDMGGLPDVKQVRSLSKTGLSQVIVIFEDHVDTYFARQVVFERLARAAEMGAALTIRPQEVHMQEAIREFAEGAGPDAVIEAVGLPVTIRQAIDWVRPGGRVAIVGQSNRSAPLSA